MAWRIRLSDLVTLNYSLIWVALASMLVFTVVTITSSSTATFGQIIASVMYVFGFIESVLAFPFYYEQLVRLQEIAARLSGVGGSEDTQRIG